MNDDTLSVSKGVAFAYKLNGQIGAEGFHCEKNA